MILVSRRESLQCQPAPSDIGGVYHTAELPCGPASISEGGASSVFFAEDFRRRRQWRTKAIRLATRSPKTIPPMVAPAMTPPGVFELQKSCGGAGAVVIAAAAADGLVQFEVELIASALRSAAAF